MKQFKFVGEPGERLHLEDVIHEAFGLDFSGGVSVDVEDPAVIEKLTNNSHYEEVDAEPTPPPASDKAKKPAQMNKTELAAHGAELGHELDQSKTKAQMLDQLADLIKKAKADGEDD